MLLENGPCGGAAAAAAQVQEIKFVKCVYSVKFEVNGQWSGSVVLIADAS
jgi:hypothetical protein